MTNDRAAPEPWLSLVGIGEDGIAGLSATAQDRVKSAELVVGGQRHLRLAGALIRGERMTWRSPIDATMPEILSRRGRPVCVLATGDPYHYGVGALLSRHVPAVETRCWPQPSAFSLAASRLGWSLEACCCLSVHGRALHRIVPALRHGERLLVLSWDETTPARLAELLVSRGFGSSRIWVGEALGGPSERARDTRPDAFDLDAVQPLNVVACALVADPGARQCPITPGLPDDWFAHDGQITKAPIRAVTLAALAPRPGEHLWDLGAGSGSVGIEWLLSHPSTRVTAVERDADRAARVAENAASFGVTDRIVVRQGEMPSAIVDLAPPDAVFIGGGLTEPGTLDAAQSALRAGGRLVANAVTLESQTLLSQHFGRYGGELLSLAVARAEPVGAFHGFRPAMPILQWRWIKP